MFAKAGLGRIKKRWGLNISMELERFLSDFSLFRTGRMHLIHKNQGG
jgi:hypothetical protein